MTSAVQVLIDTSTSANYPESYNPYSLMCACCMPTEQTREATTNQHSERPMLRWPVNHVADQLIATAHGHPFE
jgi:hypothetical protein